MTGILFSQALPSGCTRYTSKGSITPVSPEINDAIIINDPFLVGSASVNINLTHRRIGALEIKLSSAPLKENTTEADARTIVLKEQGLGRLGANMFDTSFNDNAPQSFPVGQDWAPFSGSYRPTQRLSFLWDDANSTIAGINGGSQGAWVLNIKDIAPNSNLRSIALNGWSLILCEQAMPGMDQSQPPVYPNPSSGCYTSSSAPVHTTIVPPTTSDTIPMGEPAPEYLPTITALDGPPDSSAVQPASTAFQFDPTPKAPLGGLFGWRFGWKDSSISVPASETVYSSASTPPPLVNIPAMESAVLPSGSNLLQQLYGSYCTDASCSNLKSGIWKTVILSMLARSSIKGGELSPTNLLKGFSSVLPNVKNKKAATAVSKWLDEQASWLKDNRGELLRGAVMLGKKLSDFNGGSDDMSGMISAMAASGADPSQFLGLLGEPRSSVPATTPTAATSPAPTAASTSGSTVDALQRSGGDSAAFLDNLAAQSVAALQQGLGQAGTSAMNDFASQLGMTDAGELSQVIQGLQEAGMGDILTDFLSPI